MNKSFEKRAAADYDSVWKDAIELYFDFFMAFFFPQGHALINWKRGVEFLNTELKRVTRNAVMGRGHIDKLVKVFLKSGEEVWIVIHIEIQSQKDGNFELRMKVYSCRLFDRYRRPVVSLAILADSDPDWRPNSYGYSIMGFESAMRFPIAKLTDFRDRMAELETSANPFAVIVLAHLKTMETQREPQRRLSAKVEMIKGLRRRGLSRMQILELFRLIDGMMTLPDEMDRKFQVEMENIEKEEHMPYMTRWEKQGIEKGIEKGIEQGEKIGIVKGEKIGIVKGALENAREMLLLVLQERFEKIPATAMRKINGMDDLARLKGLLRSATRTGSLKSFLNELEK